jgi:hypothetical protein
VGDDLQRLDVGGRVDDAFGEGEAEGEVLEACGEAIITACVVPL